MKKIQIISDTNQKSLKIKSQLIKILIKNKFIKSNITIVKFDIFNLFFFISFETKDLIFFDFLFMSEIIFIFFIKLYFLKSEKVYQTNYLNFFFSFNFMVPSARLELALRKRQGF